jgi:Animal haem peroxidase
MPDPIVHGKQWNRSNAAHGGTTIRPPRHSVEFTDRFDFMVEHLPPNRSTDDDLMALGAAVMEGEEPDDTDPINNHRIPAGYTYFGQFVDHDLTFDPLSVLGGPNKINDLLNFRTPRFDLDSLYGHGPHDQPYMYDGAKFRLGQTADNQPDLLRIDQPSHVGDKLAVIGDKRNDENLIVSQIQLAFLLYHNKVVDELAAKKVDADKLFDIANQIVRWRYQHIVLFDYFRRLALPDVFEHLVDHGPQFFQTPKGVFMPIEFSVAAFRMGHSMVRFNYALNRIVNTDQGGTGELKVFDTDPAKDLRGFRPRPSDRTIRWKRFLEFIEDDPVDPGSKVQFSMALDTGLAGKIVPPPPADASVGLAGMPVDVPEDGKPPHNLAQRNLLRGRHLGRGLPSGQTLARHLGVNDHNILTKLDVTVSVKKAGAKPADPMVFTRQVDARLTGVFGADTPLWYYILKEAERLGLKADDAHPLGDAGIELNADGTNGGRTLGPLGSRIVGEVFFKLMKEDSESILGKGTTVVPRDVAGRVPAAGQFGAGEGGRFTLAHVMRYVHALPLTVTPQANFGLVSSSKQ